MVDIGQWTVRNVRKAPGGGAGRANWRLATGQRCYIMTVLNLPAIPPAFHTKGSPLNASRYSIGILAILALVALRIGIGWHFLQQGLDKYENPKFSSEPFLRQAKGPLADRYRAMIPDFHGFDDAMDDLLGDNQAEITDIRKVLEDKANPLVQWAGKVKQDWGKYAADAASHYEYSETPANNERAAAESRLNVAFEKLDDAVAEFRDWLVDNAHEVAYLHKLERSKTGNEVPFEKARLAEQQAEVNGPRMKLKSDVAAIEKELEAELYNVLSPDNREKHDPLPSEETSLAKFDRFLTYSLIAIGACLMAGLLTPIAALGGAFFLLSVMATQPPWVMDALPIYEQAIEFLALLVIATTMSGRWLGLDYFLGKLCGCCGGAKGNC
jgi:uncharacterized membrane protein YphA (DoxX/SURF4 family)